MADISKQVLQAAQQYLVICVFLKNQIYWKSIYSTSITEQEIKMKKTNVFLIQIALQNILGYGFFNLFFFCLM